MKDQETKNRFIELRAQGKSFQTIAEEIGVSKQTLITWSKDLQTQIENLKAIGLEALREKYYMTEHGRIEAIGTEVEKIKTELDKRDLSDVPTGTLFNTYLKFLSLLEKEGKEITFSKYSNFDVDLRNLEAWKA